jgi:hypothetical protein
MAGEADTYAVRLRVDYPDTLDRVTTLLRVFWVIPIAIILGLITASGDTRRHANGRDRPHFGGRHPGRPRHCDGAHDCVPPAVSAMVIRFCP